MDRLVEEYGIGAYKALIDCVNVALEEEDNDLALICGLPLAELASLERADFFGSEDRYYNFNTATDLAKEALKLVEREGVSSWLRREVPRFRDIIKSWE